MPKACLSSVVPSMAATCAMRLTVACSICCNHFHGRRCNMDCSADLLGQVMTNDWQRLFVRRKEHCHSPRRNSACTCSAKVYFFGPDLFRNFGAPMRANSSLTLSNNSSSFFTGNTSDVFPPSPQGWVLNHKLNDSGQAPHIHNAFKHYFFSIFHDA